MKLSLQILFYLLSLIQPHTMQVVTMKSSLALTLLSIITIPTHHCLQPDFVDPLDVLSSPVTEVTAKPKPRVPTPSTPSPAPAVRVTPPKASFPSAVTVSKNWWGQDLGFHDLGKSTDPLSILKWSQGLAGNQRLYGRNQHQPQLLNISCTFFESYFLSCIDAYWAIFGWPTYWRFLLLCSSSLLLTAFLLVFLMVHSLWHNMCLLYSITWFIMWWSGQWYMGEIWKNEFL